MDYSSQTLQPVNTQKQDSIFIWIDLLGFSKDLENRNKYNELRVLLESFRNIFNFNKLIQSVISDGILLEIPYYVHLWKVSTIIEYFNDIAQGQLRMLLEHEKLIRGGIAIGMPIDEADRKKFMYISDGLAKAHNTEANECVYPIIGINEGELKKLRKLTGTNNEEYFGLKTDYEQRQGMYYLEFTAPLLDNVNRSSHAEKIIRFADSNYNCNELSERVRKKYKWLADHINETVGVSIENDQKEHML